MPVNYGTMKHSEITRKVIAYIMTRTVKELSLLTRDELADVFNINISYLSHRFKQDADISVFQFIEFEKIVRAKRMLEERPDLTVEEISEKFGIKKTNQFRMKFKKYYHITPGFFRTHLKRRDFGTTAPLPNGI